MPNELVLTRVIPEDECPGTCCKGPASPPFPIGEHKDCRYFVYEFPGRPHGGCMLFEEARREALLGDDDIRSWKDTCVALPYVTLDVPVERDNRFTRRSGTTWCDCFVEEECDGK